MSILKTEDAQEVVQRALTQEEASEALKMLLQVLGAATTFFPTFPAWPVSMLLLRLLNPACTLSLSLSFHCS